MKLETGRNSWVIWRQLGRKRKEEEELGESCDGIFPGWEKFVCPRKFAIVLPS